MKWKLFNGDCLEIMPNFSDQQFDMILCDLPYDNGNTTCKWDNLIPFDKLWKEYKRIIKPNGAIVLTANQPFTSALVMSNPKMFRHQWIWNKKLASNFLQAKNHPLKVHEDVLVFSKNKVNYNPIMEERGNPRIKGGNRDGSTFITNLKETITHNNVYYPQSIIIFSNANHTNKLHPTQKPVKLFEYLIKTYTNENDLILDNCAGSGTTGVACFNTGRDCIMIEKEEKYCKIINKRMKELISQKALI